MTATAAVGSACGSSNSASTPASPTPAAHSAATINASLSPGAQYAALASAVNLRPADVAGFIAHKKEPHHGLSVHNKAFEGESQYKRCFGVAAQTKPVFKAASDSFRHEERLSYESVSSSVEVMPTIASVKREFEAVRTALGSATARQCLAHIFDALGTQSQATHLHGETMRVTVGGLRLAPMSLGSVSGTNGSLGMSLSTNLTYIFTLDGRSLTVPTTMHIDALAIAVGRAEVGLTTMTIGQAFPSELEGSLFSLLVSRAVTVGRQYPAIVEHATA